MTAEELTYLINRGVLSIDALKSAIDIIELQMAEKLEAERQASRFPYHTVIYLHSDKDDNWNKFKEAGFSDEEIDKWGLEHIGYEIGIEIQINADGTVEYLGFESA